MRFRFIIPALFVSCLTAMPLGAQDPVEPDTETINGTVLVFMDCNGPSCDFNHFRREITWVSWVRQPQDADIH